MHPQDEGAFICGCICSWVCAFPECIRLLEARGCELWAGGLLVSKRKSEGREGGAGTLHARSLLA